MIGAAMLWVGWFGFNAGSALAADGSAGMAMTVTHISAATASLVWIAIEWMKFGKPSLIGVVTGMGLQDWQQSHQLLVLSDLSADYALACLADSSAYGAVGFVKSKMNLDDSLDVFAVHGVGGIIGTIAAAFFALESLGGVGLGDGVTVTDQMTVPSHRCCCDNCLVCDCDTYHCLHHQSHLWLACF